MQKIEETSQKGPNNHSQYGPMQTYTYTHTNSHVWSSFSNNTIGIPSTTSHVCSLPLLLLPPPCTVIASITQPSMLLFLCWLLFLVTETIAAGIVALGALDSSVMRQLEDGKTNQHTVQLIQTITEKLVKWEMLEKYDRENCTPSPGLSWTCTLVGRSQLVLNTREK